MKQLIVLIATIVLGLSIAGTVLGMGATTQELAGDVVGNIKTVLTSTPSAIGK